jgi:hypothetical protein
VGCFAAIAHGRFWHEAADRGAATARQILRVEQTWHGRRGTAESDPHRTLGDASGNRQSDTPNGAMGSFAAKYCC